MRLIIFFLLLSNLAFSQQNNQRIAQQYYINGEYEKAIVIYKELMDKKFSVAYYIPYFTSLLKMEKHREAEFLAKRLVRKYPSQLQYQIEVLIAQHMPEKNEKSDVVFEKVLKKMNGSRAQTLSLANAFSRHQYYHKALDVYTLSEKINPNNNFGIQKAQLFSKIEEVELMLKEYLDEMDRNPRQKEMVISKIQRFLDNDGIKSDKNYRLVKKLLLAKVRGEKVRTDFSQMLVWLFMQNHQFEMALIQAKALDKRAYLQAEGVYDLAETFLDNEYFELAVEAYDYVISKGQKNYLFVDANINKLYALTRVIYKKNQDLHILDDAYKSVISDLGKNRNTVILLSNYAHFKAFYLHDLIAAEKILEDAMSITGVDDYNLAECKMEYADILLLQGSVWESMLYCAQVEKDFKEHPIGHEAKLRTAKISYYNGDFQWAQSQLEVLKASTSKLISNDAMELSLLITDNYNLDTTDIPMLLFASADLLNYQQRYDEAIVKYDSILTLFRGHTLSDEIYMRKAEVYFNLGKITDALDTYEKIEMEWGYDILADDALYERARIYDVVLNDFASAMTLYEKILLDYSSSIYVVESRKRFRELRGDGLTEDQ